MRRKISEGPENLVKPRLSGPSLQLLHKSFNNKAALRTFSNAAVSSLAGTLFVSREFANDLPALSDIPDLNDFAENGSGIAAFDGGKMVGVLSCYLPFDNVFGSTDAKGIFSPMGANAAVSENRSKIYDFLSKGK